MKTNFVYLPLLIALIVSGCNRDKGDDSVTPVKKEGSVRISVSYSVDGQPLLFDTLLYQNEAGNPYEVSRIIYYITGFTFFKTDGSTCHSDHVQYIDASDDSTNSFLISSIPNGSYSSMKFYIGLDSVRNIPGGLPNTWENLNMEWPVSMGGGYHFLKFEGYYTDTCCSNGFAMHIGRNECLVTVNHPVSFQMESNEIPLSLNMNVSEWFKNPHTWDLNTDGNYTMGNLPAMLKLAENGADVFNQ